MCQTEYRTSVLAYVCFPSVYSTGQNSTGAVLNVQPEATSTTRPRRHDAFLYHTGRPYTTRVSVEPD